MASVSGGLYYSSVVPPAEDRESFDGSVPYAVSAAGIATLSNSSGSAAAASVVFSLIGQPSSDIVQYTSPAARVGIQKAVSVNLRDLWLVVSGAGPGLRCTITVCDPSSFPSSADHVYLYDGEVDSTESPCYIKIPDIEKIALVGNVSQPLNVCMKLYGWMSVGSTISVSYHCVSVVDD